MWVFVWFIFNLSTRDLGDIVVKYKAMPRILKRGGAGADFLIVIGLIVAMWFVWFLTGGPQRTKEGGGNIFTQSSLPSAGSPISTDGPFFVNDNVASSSQAENKNIPNESKYKGLVKMRRGRMLMKKTQERIRCFGGGWNNKEQVIISGWKLTNVGRVSWTLRLVKYQLPLCPCN